MSYSNLTDPSDVKVGHDQEGDLARVIVDVYRDSMVTKLWPDCWCEVTRVEVVVVDQITDIQSHPRHHLAV